MGRIYYCSLPSRVVQFIIHVLMAAQLVSITEDELSNFKTQFPSDCPVLKVLSQTVTAEEKQRVTGEDIAGVWQRILKYFHIMTKNREVFYDHGILSAMSILPTAQSKHGRKSTGLEI